MFISEISGHHQASIAVEDALHALDPGVETLNINTFHFTNPILEKVINRAYMSVIKNIPELWNYLYDNPKVVRRTQRLKDSIHRFNSKKLKELLDDFRPDGIACTQAFPCGMVADFKKCFDMQMPLVGILTDYAPHSYWIYSNVDAYVVPSEETGQRLIEYGISKDRIKPFGIPVHPKFRNNLDKKMIMAKLGLRGDVPVVLLMGGGLGLGPIKKVAWALDKLPENLQIIVITGSNRNLYNYLVRKKDLFRKNMLVTSFADNMDELMSIASLVITKPGGMTTAEAFVKTLPMIIVNPLPGQEAMNTDFLLSKKLAVKAKDEKDVTLLVKEFLNEPDRLNSMKKSVRQYAKPDAALNTAKLILGLCSHDVHIV